MTADTTPQDFAFESARPVTAEDMTRFDVEGERADGYELDIYCLVNAEGYRETNNTGIQVLYHAEAGRAGVIYGGSDLWTDCISSEDAVRRYLSDEMIN